MFIENYEAGKFSGRVIDWEGLGAQGEVSKLSGFIDGNFISFTKEYTHLHVIDQWGNTASHSDVPGHMVFYKGVYDRDSKCFHGSWKTSPEVVTIDELTIEEVNTGTGTWRMYSHD